MAARTDSPVNVLAKSIRRDPLRAAQQILDREQELLQALRQVQHEHGLALLKIEKLEEEKRLARAERFGTSSIRGTHCLTKPSSTLPMYSLIGTCRLNGVDPWAYLTDVLARLPRPPANDIDALLPMNWTSRTRAP
jgi:hypothetical protein